MTTVPDQTAAGTTAARRRVYLDNASTRHPKRAGVLEAIQAFDDEIGASPGRGSHRSARQASASVDAVRSAVAALVGADEPSSIAFTPNATVALNTAIRGTLRPGDHVVATVTEHNAVLRPLERARRELGCTYALVEPRPDGFLRAGDFAVELARRPSLVVLNHASNVTGVIAPVAEIAAMAKDAGATVLVDAAQTLGHLDVDVDVLGADLLAFTGHKALGGPPGTGGLYVRDPDRLAPLVVGGTGVASHALTQPRVAPTKFESGTSNYWGIVGLGAAVQAARSSVGDPAPSLLAASLRARLAGLAGVRVVTPEGPTVPIVSFVVADAYPGEVAHLLSERFGIETRAGLHCAPRMHHWLGTYPHGCVRVSLSEASTAYDLQALVDAVHELADRTAASNVEKSGVWSE